MATLGCEATVNDHEALVDLKERLVTAEHKLQQLAKEHHGSERSRLQAKAKGIALALDYLRSYEGI